MASIVLRVKPIEAELAFKHFKVDVLHTSSVLYTLKGKNVDPLKMAQILADTFTEFGFPIHISELRHALEAFSHKFSNHSSGWNPVLARMANHEPSTSARYGRDQNAFVGIPADISESNCIASNDWNSVILGSPSMLSKETESLVYKQLQELQLMGSEVLIGSRDKSQPHLGVEQQLQSISSQVLIGSRDKSQPHLGVEQQLQSMGSQVLIESRDKSQPHLGEEQQLQSMGSQVLIDSRDNSQPHPGLEHLHFSEFPRTKHVRSEMQFGDSDSMDQKRIKAEERSHLTQSQVATVQKQMNGEDRGRMTQMHPMHLLRHLSPGSAMDIDDTSDQASIRDKRQPLSSIQNINEDGEGLRPMQAQALQFLQHSTSSSIIVMPTGSGKTRLLWSYNENEDKCHVIFAPYRVLVKQLQSVLQRKGLTAVWPLHSFSGSIEALVSTARFAVFPYEAAKEGPGFLSALHEKGRLGPVWIDEVRS